MKKQIALCFLLICVSAGVIFWHQSNYEKYVPEEVVEEYKADFEFMKYQSEVNEAEYEVINYLHDSVNYQKDLVYKKDEDGNPLKLDCAYPKKDGKYPLLICLHPGSWTAGDKDEMSFYLYNFSCRDYFVATIEYGLVPEYSMIDQTENILDSIEYLIHTMNNHIDEDNIIVLGASAGAHLGVLAVERLTNPEFAYREQYDFNVKLIVSGFGPLDFGYFVNNYMNFETVSYMMNHVEEITNGLAYTYEEAFKVLSPSENLNPYLPRILLIHGTDDDVVPIQQTSSFYWKLKENGIPSDFIEVKKGKHYMANKEFAEPIFYYMEEYIKGKKSNE